MEWLAPALEVIACRYFDGPTPRTTWTRLDWDRAARAALAERLGPVLGEAARVTGMELPAETWATLAAARIQSGRRRELQEAALDRIGPKMRAADVPAVVFKGLATARHYHEPRVRDAGDIDLLVPAEAMTRVDSLLQELGYRIAMTRDPRVADTPYAVSYACGEEEVWLEIHPAWQEVRLDAGGPAVTVGGRRYDLTDAQLGREPWPVLPPALELYVSAAHAVLHNPRTLSLYLDVSIMARSADEATLDEVRELSLEQGRERHLRHALSAAADLFGIELDRRDASLPRRLGIPVAARLGSPGLGLRLLPSPVVLELLWRRGLSRKLSFVRWLAGHAANEENEGTVRGRPGWPKRVWLMLRGLRWLKGMVLKYGKGELPPLRP